MADEKVAPKGTDPRAQPDGSVSGEFVRRREPEPEQEPFRPKSTRRRALHPRAPADLEPPSDSAEQFPPAKQDEEQTLRSVRVPQRIRMSLRMRRVAAGTSADGAPPLRAQDRVGLRLAGQLFELLAGDELTAGRSGECEVVLGDRLCSRRHAAFSRTEDGGVLVRDLGSMNGTYVNGVRILTAQRLVASDWITLGNETLELCLAAPVQSAQAPTIPAGPKRQAGAAQANRGRSSAKTDPGSPLLSLASFAASSTGQASTPVPAAAARKPLDALMRRIDSGGTIDEADARMGTLVALHLTRATADASWLDYAFRLYSALRSPLPAELLARLRETLSLVPARELSAMRRHVELLQHARADFDELGQQLAAELSALYAQLAAESRQR